MKPLHYQALADKGWRRYGSPVDCVQLTDLVTRSGTTYYKPDVRHACCPHYTIRLVLGRN